MDDRFDQEFYRSQWQRVLATAPGGLQPYIHTETPPRLPGLRLLGRSLGRLGALARRLIALGRFAAIGLAKRPLSLEAGPPARRRPSLRLVHANARPAARRAQAPRHPSRAA